MKHTALFKTACAIPELGGGGKPHAELLIRYAAAVRENIIDVGPWLGSQTAFLALGVIESASGARIHSYDPWTIGTEEFKEKVLKHRGLYFRVGADLLPLWKVNVTPFSAVEIVPHQMDVNRASWPGGSVDLLVDDTGAGVNQKALDTFLPFMPVGGHLIFMDWGFIRGGKPFPWQREWYEKQKHFELVEEFGTAGVFKKVRA